MEERMIEWTVIVFEILQKAAYSNAKEKGFWETSRTLAEQIALQHSELSEVLEADRHGNPASTKCSGFSQIEEEYADLLIRVLDTAGHYKLRLAQAVLAKMEYNRTRPHKHSKTY